MKYIKNLSLSLIFMGVLSCTNLPETDYYEVDGVVSIEAGNSSDGSGDQQENLTASFYIKNPGQYSLWTLTSKFSDEPDDNSIPVRITNEDGFLLLEERLELPSNDLLEWVNRSQTTGEELVAEFDSPGMYQVSYLPNDTPGYKIDKIHLTLNNEHIPAGRGLPETTSADVDPILVKRDQPIVIPPSRAFGTVLGGFESVEQADRLIQILKDENIGFDALWLENGNELLSNQDSETAQEVQNFFQTLKDNHLMGGLNVNDEKIGSTETVFQTGAQFSVLDGTPDLEQIRLYFEASQNFGDRQNNRGFILAPMNSIYDPDFKLYPVTKFSNTFINPDHYDDINRYGMELLKLNIEMVSNTRLSTYEIPFLAPGFDWGESFEDSEISEELFLRWMQFAAFSSIFNLSGILSKIDIETLSDEANHQFRELTHLRNRLFPYIYSTAHFIRAGGIKPMRGDGVRATQYLLGEAFLVAPIYEPGTDQRTVYFPDGTWYDYWDGTAYSGGQSWVIEASEDRLPLFVKAGSIVPYRDYSQKILDGSNENLTIEIYGDGVSSFRLYEDDGLTTHYQTSEFSTTAYRYFEHEDYATFTIGSMVRSYEGQPESKKLKLNFRYIAEPERVTVNGNSLQKGEETGDWFYSDQENTLSINWEQPNYQKTDFRINFRN